MLSNSFYNLDTQIRRGRSLTLVLILSTIATTRKVSTRFRSSSSTSSSSTSSSCSLSNHPSIDTHSHIYHPHNLSSQQHSVPLPSQIYHHPSNQAPLPDQAIGGTESRTGRQLPHIPGQQTYYQFHSQLQSQQQTVIMSENQQSLESSPSPKTPLGQRAAVGNQSKFANALNSAQNVATAFRFPPTVSTPLKTQSSDEYSTTMSSHRSRSSSEDADLQQSTSPVPMAMQTANRNAPGVQSASVPTACPMVSPLLLG